MKQSTSSFIFLFFIFLLKDWNDILKEALGKPSADSYCGTEGDH